MYGAWALPRISPRLWFSMTIVNTVPPFQAGATTAELFVTGSHATFVLPELLAQPESDSAPWQVLVPCCNPCRWPSRPHGVVGSRQEMPDPAFGRVPTFNIWIRQGPWDRRLPLIRDGLAALAADVIGLQEVLAFGSLPSQA